MTDLGSDFFLRVDSYFLMVFDDWQTLLRECSLLKDFSENSAGLMNSWTAVYLIFVEDQILLFFE
jgi:hypothetical protein